jgi:hypothetical protein
MVLKSLGSYQTPCSPAENMSLMRWNSVIPGHSNGADMGERNNGVSRLVSTV